MTRLRRFLHIERPRADGAEAGPAPSADTAERIAGVERPARRADVPAGSGAGLERFAPAPPPAIELVSTEAGERPFTRCMRCGMDHNVFATECSGCHASLDTVPQREFNERLWAARQAEAAREAAAEAARRELQARDGADAADSRRALGEELAREVGARERARLDAELGDGGSAWAALGRLLRRLLGGLAG